MYVVRVRQADGVAVLCHVPLFGWDVLVRNDGLKYHPLE